MNLETIDYHLVALLIFFAFVNLRISWLVHKLRSWETLILGIILALLLAGNITSRNVFLAFPDRFSEYLIFLLVFFALTPELLRLTTALIWRALPNKSGTNRDTIQEILSGAEILSSTKTGALIAFERSDDLSKLAQSGTVVNSDVKKELLTALFSKEALTHDGGVIIKNGRIAHCSVIFPITFSLTIDKNLGTRHRAAIGLTEATDAVCLIVSEEEGTISLAQDGKIFYNLNRQTLERNLGNWLFKKSKKIGFFAHRLRSLSLRENSQAALRFFASPLASAYHLVVLLFWILIAFNLIVLSKGALTRESVVSYWAPQLFFSEMWKWLAVAQILIQSLVVITKSECHLDQNAQTLSKEWRLTAIPIWRIKRSFNEIKRILVKREGKQSFLWSLLVEDADGKKISLDSSGFPNELLEDGKKIQNFLKIELVNQS